MTLSPQLRAIGPDIRVLAVLIDAIAAYGRYCEQVQARIDTAWLTESRSGVGWQVTPAERMMAERGWHSAEDIFNEAGIPDKHRRVVELALWGDPTKHKGRMFTTREIAEMTGHPERTCKLWLSMDMPRLRTLAAALESVA
jgi:DNA-directed RNA polymerase specialized sigma24 family protein